VEHSRTGSDIWGRWSQDRRDPWPFGQDPFSALTLALFVIQRRRLVPDIR
jgi:hypothetical protein